MKKCGFQQKYMYQQKLMDEKRIRYQCTDMYQ